MQLAPSPSPSAPPAAAPVLAGGIAFAGTHDRFSAFAATPRGGAYGKADGYETLPEAIDALTLLTVGAHQPAAGVYERDGRFHGRRLLNSVTFNSGATWSGMWRLEQHPSDTTLLTAKAGTTRSAALRAIVDGAQRIDVTHLPVA